MFLTESYGNQLDRLPVLQAPCPRFLHMSIKTKQNLDYMTISLSWVWFLETAHFLGDNTPCVALSLLHRIHKPYDPSVSCSHPTMTHCPIVKTALPCKLSKIGRWGKLMPNRHICINHVVLLTYIVVHAESCRVSMCECRTEGSIAEGGTSASIHLEWGGTLKGMEFC